MLSLWPTFHFQYYCTRNCNRFLRVQTQSVWFNAIKLLLDVAFSFTAWAWNENVELPFDRPSTLVRGRARGHKRHRTPRLLRRQEGEERSFPPALPPPVEIMQSRIAQRLLVILHDKKQANTMLSSVSLCLCVWAGDAGIEWCWRKQWVCIKLFAASATLEYRVSPPLLSSVSFGSRAPHFIFRLLQQQRNPTLGWGLMARCCPCSTICGSKLGRGSTILSN